MPTPAVDNFAGFVLSVEDPATPGTFLLVSFVERYGRRGTRTSNTRPVFGQNEEIETQGRHHNTVTISGIVATNDPGQTALRLKAGDGTAANIKALYDGVSGYSMVCGVTDDSSDEGADVDLGTFSFTLTAKQAPAVIGVAGAIF